MMRRLLRREGLAALLATGMILGACRQEAPVPPPPEGGPRLVLFIVVDQMRGDYLERFRPLWTSGLKRLLDETVTFTDAHHHHSGTATSPGHASLSTGLFPAHHGIIANGWLDRDSGEEVYAAADATFGRSPRLLLAPTLGDRIKEAYPPSRVFAVGGKDRSAILTAGKKADAAFWYNRSTGTFRTSGYYQWEDPEWAREFFEERLLDDLFGRTWESSISAEEAIPYDIEPVDLGWLTRGFPHTVGGLSAYPNESFYSAIYSTPFVDDYVVAFSKSLIENEALGQDDYPDFLGVTLSALDSVGHQYGPNSLELVDTLIRLDRSLGELLDFVDEKVGLDNVVVSLSADHGVSPVPELLRGHGEPARRFGSEEVLCYQGIGQALNERFGDERWLLAGLYLDRELVAEHNADLGELQAVVQKTLAECPGVKRVLRGEDLMAASSGSSEVRLDPIAQLFANSYHPERSADVVVQLEPHTLITSSTLTNHGSPYPYDTHVPWLLRLPSGQGGLVAERVHTVDVAPTLAGLLGLPWDGPNDGTDRGDLLAVP